MGNNIVETLIGAVVLVVAGFFVFFAYSTAGVAVVDGYEITARFSRVDGLAVGSDVRLSGIKVGTVVGQELDAETFDAVVSMQIADAIKIPDDTAVKISSTGLLGDAYISLEPGGSEDMVENGGELQYTQGAVNVLDLIAQAVFGAAGGGDTK